MSITFGVFFSLPFLSIENLNIYQPTTASLWGRVIYICRRSSRLWDHIYVIYVKVARKRESKVCVMFDSRNDKWEQLYTSLNHASCYHSHHYVFRQSEWLPNNAALFPHFLHHIYILSSGCREHNIFIAWSGWKLSDRHSSQGHKPQAEGSLSGVSRRRDRLYDQVKARHCRECQRAEMYGQ